MGDFTKCEMCNKEVATVQTYNNFIPKYHCVKWVCYDCNEKLNKAVNDTFDKVLETNKIHLHN